MARYAVATVGLISSGRGGAQGVPNIPTPIAPSQVTPRTLRPPPSSPLPPPIDFRKSLPSEAPAGAAQVAITVAAIEAIDGFPEMATKTRAIFGPLEGKPITVGDLYRAAADLEAAYTRAGFFLARIVVPEQRVTKGGIFRVTVVDGFIETLDTSALPRKLRNPIDRILSGIVGKRHPKLEDMQRRMDLAQAVPGARVRSTLAKGDSPGGARLILDGGFKPLDLTLSSDNRLGPSFNDWGINLQMALNSPTGHGEQLYMFLSGQPRVDQNFKKGALRRVGGGGLTLPITGWGLAINPEFTISDTNPTVANPLFASNGRLYRGAFSLIAPILSTSAGTLTSRFTIEITRERQTLPAFNFVLSDDRLSVLRANLGWRGPLWRGASIGVSATFSTGTALFGARTPRSINRAGIPTSRGSDPQFTDAAIRSTVQQALPAHAILTVIGSAQTSIGHLLPNSETFDLTGMDGLSTFTAGLLSADGGGLVRGELSRPIAVQAAALRLSATPYVFGAYGHAHYVIPDPLSPTAATSYGLGIRLAGEGFPLGAAPNATIEYGHGSQNRGGLSNNRLSVSLGVQF